MGNALTRVIECVCVDGSIMKHRPRVMSHGQPGPRVLIKRPACPRKTPAVTAVTTALSNRAAGVISGHGARGLATSPTWTPTRAPTRTHTHTHTHICIHTSNVLGNSQTDVDVHADTDIHTCMQAHTQKHTETHRNTRTHTHTQSGTQQYTQGVCWVKRAHLSLQCDSEQTQINETRC